MLPFRSSQGLRRLGNCKKGRQTREILPEKLTWGRWRKNLSCQIEPAQSPAPTRIVRQRETRNPEPTQLSPGTRAPPFSTANATRLPRPSTSHQLEEDGSRHSGPWTWTVVSAESSRGAVFQRRISRPLGGFSSILRAERRAGKVQLDRQGVADQIPLVMGIPLRLRCLRRARALTKSQCAQPNTTLSWGTGMGAEEKE